MSEKMTERIDLANQCLSASMPGWKFSLSTSGLSVISPNGHANPMRTWSIGQQAPPGDGPKNYHHYRNAFTSSAFMWRYGVPNGIQDQVSLIALLAAWIVGKFGFPHWFLESQDPMWRDTKFRAKLEPFWQEAERLGL